MSTATQNLYLASEKNDVAGVERALEDGADVNWKNPKKVLAYFFPPLRPIWTRRAWAPLGAGPAPSPSPCQSPIPAPTPIRARIPSSSPAPSPAPSPVPVQIQPQLYPQIQLHPQLHLQLHP